MSQTQWTAVDDYLNGLLVPSDPALDAALQASADAALPEMQVAPNQGKLLSILARSINARTILEIGTLGGYSTIWLARALPAGGRLITLELDPKHAEVARLNLVRAGLADVTEVRVGRALDTLPQLVTEGRGPFDLVFIDADKQNSAPYFEWALKLTRPGSVIIVDNVVRDGGILDPNHPDDRVHGIRRFYERLAVEKTVTASAIQTVGNKGYDGFCIAYVLPS